MQQTGYAQPPAYGPVPAQPQQGGQVQQASRKIVAGMAARFNGDDPNAPASPYTPMHGPVFTPASQHRQGVPYYGPDGMITTRIAEEDDWDESGPLETFLTQLSFQTYWRTEYLLWRVEEPGNEYLGAELAPGLSPESLTLFDDSDPPQEIGTGRVFNTGNIMLRDINGVRMTVGVPLTFGAFELSGFALEQSGEKAEAGDIPDTDVFIVTPLSTGGGPATTGLTYDQFFNVNYSTDVYGVQSRLIFDMSPPGEGFKLNPLIGFQFIDLQEQMVQSGGSFDTQSSTVLQSVIDSNTNNNVWGPTLGFRAELVHRWFTVGVEPKLGVTFNSYQAEVETVNLRGSEDGVFTTKDRSTDFSPSFELQAYARLKLNEYCALTASANYLYIYKTARPANVIDYGDNGDFPVPPGVVVDTDLKDIWFHGVSGGLEITLP